MAVVAVVVVMVAVVVGEWAAAVGEGAAAASAMRAAAAAPEPVGKRVLAARAVARGESVPGRGYSGLARRLLAHGEGGGVPAPNELRRVRAWVRARVRARVRAKVGLGLGLGLG